FEYGRQGHYRSDCPKLKDNNRGNKTRNKSRIGEARGKSYVLGWGDANTDSNVVTAEPTRLQDAIQITNNLMAQKLKGYAFKNAENKMRMWQGHTRLGTVRRRGMMGLCHTIISLSYITRGNVPYNARIARKWGIWPEIAGMQLLQPPREPKWRIRGL
nr:hypothetical protein [Tanacetum cinerariifolium]